MNKRFEPLIENLRRPAFPGSFFVSFEGIEGAGKSSQIKLVSQYLEQKGFRVITLREPGGSVFGERLRQAVLDSKQELHPASEAHLFASARAQLIHEVILSELSQPGTVVICDRYLDSTIAYQGHARGLGVEYILNIHQCFPLNLVPHLTFYLRIDWETSQVRQKMRNAPKDYFEARGKDFYQKLIEGYDLTAQLFSQRVKIIDALNSEKNVFQMITQEIDKLIFEKQIPLNDD